MARTKRQRPSQGISNILSQRRQASQQQIEESEEDERDSLIESDDQPRQHNRRSSSSGGDGAFKSGSDGAFKSGGDGAFKSGSDGTFKRPFPVEGSSRVDTPISKLNPVVNLDLSVTKYAQQKLVVVREIPEVARAKIEESSIHFVLDEKGMLSHYMNLSYAEAMSSKNLDQSTIFKTSAFDIMKKLEEGKQVVGTYVLEFFEGDFYERLLDHSKVDRKCRIYGPDVLIQAKNVNHIPRSNMPLLSLSMIGLTVSSSSYSSQEKEQFEKKITMMGGRFSRQLLKNTSVLVAKDVISQKSQIARKHKIPIVSDEWINKCWTAAHRQRIVRALDKIDECRIPIFAGVKLSVSQVGPEIRTKLEKSAKKYGYEYNPNLSERITHLICLRDEGQKFDFSRDHNIYTVDYKWIVKSVESKYALSEVHFMIGGPLDKDDDDPLALKVQRKTTIETVIERSQRPQPSRKKNQMMPSSVDGNVHSRKNQMMPSSVDGNVHSRKKNQMMPSSMDGNVHSRKKNQAMPSSMDGNVERITRTLNETKVENEESSKISPTDQLISCLRNCLKSEPRGLLDAVEINLCGFKNRESLSLCKQLIAHESGFCAMRISETTTVVVVSQDCPENELNGLKTTLNQKECFCPVVSQSWLIDSVKNSKLEPYSNYIVFSIENVSIEEHMVDIVEEEVNQPSLGFVVKKKDRSMVQDRSSTRSKVVPSHEMEVDDIVHLSQSTQRSSVNLLDSIQEVAKSYGGRTDSSWTTEDGSNHDSDCEDEEHEDEEAGDEDEEENSPEKSISYATQAGMNQNKAPKRSWQVSEVSSSQVSELAVPERQERVFIDALSSMAGNYYKTEDGREAKKRMDEANIIAQKMRKTNRRY